MWDFLPVNLNEVKQIEVIRGPASAVWGANALNGVVNVITKSPREMQGTSAVLRLRRLRPAGRATPASLWYVSGTHAEAINERWAYKLSAGGLLAGRVLAADRARFRATTPRCARSTRATYPAFVNQGTTQPKFDARVDYDYQDGTEAVVLGRHRRHRRHHAHRHRPVRHQQRLGDGLRQGELHQGRAARRRSSPTSSAATPNNLLTRRPDRRADHLRLRHQDLRPRRVERADVRRSATSSATAATCASTSSICRLRPDADNRTEFGVFAPGRDLPLRHVPLVASAAASTGSTTSTTSCSRRAPRFMIKPQREPDVPRLVQPRLPVTVGDQQLIDLVIAQPRRPRPSPGAGRADLSRCRSTSSAIPISRSSRSTPSRSATRASWPTAAR